MRWRERKSKCWGNDLSVMGGREVAEARTSSGRPGRMVAAEGGGGGRWM